MGQTASQNTNFTLNGRQLQFSPNAKPDAWQVRYIIYSHRSMCNEAGSYDHGMRIAMLLIFSLRVAVCCEVIGLPVKNAFKQAQIVFRGKVTEVYDSEVIFQVDRVWKGRVPSRFSMPKLIWSATPCMPGFYKGYVKPGSELLVYARQVPELKVSGYVPTPGSRTAPVEYAIEDLKRLGPGHPPR